MSTNFHDFQQPNLNTLTPNQRNNLIDNVNRHVEWLKKTKKDANQRLSRIHHDLNQLDDSRYPTNEALREAKQEKMRLANQIEAGLTFIEEQYKLWNEYYNTIKERTGSGFSREREHFDNIRKVGGAVDFNRERENMEQQEYERQRNERDLAEGRERRREEARQEARRIRAENERIRNERFNESIENDEMLNEDTRRIDIWRRSGRSGHRRALDRLGMRNEDTRGLDRIERWREQQRHR